MKPDTANLKSPSLFRIRTLVVIVVVFAFLGLSGFAEDAIDRLKLERLRRLHDAIATMEGMRQEKEILRTYVDHRANLHVHSAFSHDSRGTIEEIVVAAKQAGTSVLMFSEHPAAHYDFFVDGHQGLRDGVLLIPGAEMNGFLVYPMQSLKGKEQLEKQDLSNAIRERGGLTFVSHLEERMEWEVRGVTGCEIYNTHADFKTEKRLLSSLKNPLWLIQAKAMFDTYPQEALSAILDYPADYLKRYDQLCQIHPHTGVSANDAHQNVGLVLRLTDAGKISVEDPLGEKLLELDRAIYEAAQPIPDTAKAGDVLYRLQLDPYAKSLRHVGTHLLMRGLTQADVWESLNAGRAYVSFDWLGETRGFDLSIVTGSTRHEMGSQLSWKEGSRMVGYSPLPVRWKIFRNGELIHEAQARDLDWPVSQSGIYRAECWLSLADTDYIWILANPFYLR
ncbi:MAG: PHP domain-containing protein [Pirellulales bacterium]